MAVMVGSLTTAPQTCTVICSPLEVRWIASSAIHDPDLIVEHVRLDDLFQPHLDPGFQIDAAGNQTPAENDNPAYSACRIALPLSLANRCVDTMNASLRLAEIEILRVQHWCAPQLD